MLKARSFICACLLFGGVVPLYSQNTQLTGFVQDTQKLAIVGATVTLTNEETNIKRTTTSNDAGLYRFPYIQPGRYEVSASAAGFQTSVRKGVKLDVGESARIDLLLPVGATQQSVTVTGDVSKVEVESSSLGTLVEQKRIAELPLQGRTVWNLLKLAPGVKTKGNSTTVGFADGQGGGSSYSLSINGGPYYGVQTYVDGGAVTIPNHNDIGIMPALDAVEEFRVETNSMKAEYGQTSGGVISLVTKPGTNELHGSLYEFLRNDALDARNAFATRKDSLGRLKPITRYNQFGGTLGGPVFIPKVYNGKNRTFFFVGKENWRHRTSSLQRSTVPTAVEKSGDFSNTRDGTGKVIPIYDPASGRVNPSGSGWVRDPLPGNIVPSSRFDAVSLNVLKYMPEANTTPTNPYTNSNNFLVIPVSKSDFGSTNIRVDHHFSEADSASFRYTGQRHTAVGAGYGLGVADPLEMTRKDQRDQHNWLFTETHVFSPQTIHEFKGNVSRSALVYQHASAWGNWPEKLGFPKIIPQNLFPRVNISGVLSLGAGGNPVGWRGQHTVQATDSLTMMRGRHQIKVGVDQRWMRVNFATGTNSSGLFNFGGLTSNPQVASGTGFGMADFLLGDVASGSLNILPYFAFHAWSNGSYIQDDVKVARRLTLNLGLRYDIESGPVERWNRYSSFDPFLTNRETGMPGVLAYAGSTAPRHFVDRDTNNFGPRFGFAYDLTGDGKTALRGGYGVTYVSTESSDTQADSSNSLGFSATTSFASSSGPFKAFQFSAGPTTLIRPLGAAGGPSAFRGQAVRYQDRNAPTGYVQQWNLTLQRELPGQWIVTASYAGNHGVKLIGANYNLNQLDPSNWSLKLGLQDRVPNPFYGQIATGSLSGKTVSRSALLVPFPDYGGVTTMSNHGVSSSYHSLQLTFEKRFSKGLSALITYTDSKLINDSVSVQSGGSEANSGDYRIGRLNRRLDRAIDQYDVSQRLVISAVYEIPFGRGKPLLSGASRPLNAVVGGWQVNSVTTIQTGYPLTVRGSGNFTGINWPDLLRDPTLPRSERSQHGWFDTSAFGRPGDWVMGNAPRTLPNTRAPGIFDMGFSAMKKFRFRERMELEFRAEAFNLPNWVNLGSPNVSFSPNSQGVNTNANFGRIFSAQSARTVQFGLHLGF